MSRVSVRRNTAHVAEWLVIVQEDEHHDLNRERLAGNNALVSSVLVDCAGFSHSPKTFSGNISVCTKGEREWG